MREPAAANTDKKKKVSYYRKPLDLSIDEWQAALREQYAAYQFFEIKNLGSHPVYSDFEVFNPKSGKSYKVAIRDNENSPHFCSCPDFKVNGLGTCKHIENVLLNLSKNKKNWSFFNQVQSRTYSSLSIYYGKERYLRLNPGGENHEKIQQLFQPVMDQEGFILPDKIDQLDEYIREAKEIDENFNVYHDAYDFIQNIKAQKDRETLVNQIFSNGSRGKVFDELIKTRLYPYQQEGVRKAFQAGRVLIADEMGLGKTIQAIAAVELFSRYSDVKSVMIICPTSLKYQWQKEIEKFTDRSTLIVEGLIHKRKKHYKETNAFYKILSYGVTRNDLEFINEASPDLVILDEAQRIKNWKTKTAQTIKSIQAPYTIVLTGTPLENRLEELHSIIEYIDMYKLGPLFRFLNHHEITDDFGKVEGYRNLKSINKTLDSILVRRTKKEIIDQLPDRIDKNFFVDMTEEQIRDHNDYYENVCRLVNSWRNKGFLTEEERQNLLINLGCMRMVCDSTYILNPKERHDVKPGELSNLLDEILENEDNKVVIFSEWKKMFELIIQELEKKGIEYVYLNGDVSPKKRKEIISRFHDEPSLKIFLSTDAGGVGLNLQCANIIINLDLPWNPAKLEQRIARVHRLGQNQHVYIYNFITKGSIENRIYRLLGFKKSVFSGALDGDKDSVVLNENNIKSFMESVQELTETNPLEENTHNMDDFEGPRYGTNVNQQEAEVTQKLNTVSLNYQPEGQDKGQPSIHFEQATKDKSDSIKDPETTHQYTNHPSLKNQPEALDHGDPLSRNQLETQDQGHASIENQPETQDHSHASTTDQPETQDHSHTSTKKHLENGGVKNIGRPDGPKKDKLKNKRLFSRLGKSIKKWFKKLI